MSLAYTGNFALPIQYARATLAASTTWQGILGASNASDALAKMFTGETDENAAGDARPRALIDIAGSYSSDKVSSTGFLHGSEIEVVFEIDTPAAYQGDSSRREARVWFYNLLGAILAEMEALAGQAGYLNILNFREQNTGRVDPKENNGDDFWVSIVHLVWQG